MKTTQEIRDAFYRVHRRACGETREVYMSIPARPEHDADYIVTDAIDELERLRAEVASLRQELGHIHPDTGKFTDVSEANHSVKALEAIRLRQVDEIEKLQAQRASLRQGVETLRKVAYRLAGRYCEEESTKTGQRFGLRIDGSFENVRCDRPSCDVCFARAALRETEGLVASPECKHLEVREAPMFSPPGMLECGWCRTLVPSKGLGRKAEGPVKP